MLSSWLNSHSAWSCDSAGYYIPPKGLVPTGTSFKKAKQIYFNFWHFDGNDNEFDGCDFVPGRVLLMYRMLYSTYRMLYTMYRMPCTQTWWIHTMPFEVTLVICLDMSSHYKYKNFYWLHWQLTHEINRRFTTTYTMFTTPYTTYTRSTLMYRKFSIN